MTKPITFEGRTIEVPDDATDAEVATILSSYPNPNFDTTAGGAAIMRPRTPARSLRRPASEVLTDIGGATALGAGMGLVAPEIIQGVGAVAKAIPTPLTQAIGAGTEFLGRTARAASAPARVASGALSGLGSETAGKLAESELAQSVGAGPITAEAARFVGGGLTPEFARYAGTTVANVLSHWAMPGRLDAAAMRTMAGQISQKISRATGQPLSEYEQAYVAKLVADVQGSRKPGEALGAIGAEMQAGAEDVMQAGERRAAGIRTTAETKSALDIQRESALANQRLADAKAKAAALHTEARTTLNDAQTAARAELAAAEKNAAPLGQEIEYLSALKDQTSTAAKQTRLAIGNERPLGNTEIGDELRKAAVKREEKFRTDASDRYEASKDVVNTGVAKLEKAGITIDKNPAYTKLISDLEAEMVPGKNSKDVIAGYKKIFDQITGPISYNSIDQSRKLLGDSFGNPNITGYETLSRDIKQDIYARLRDVQVKFAGPKADQMLKDYADSRPELAVFGSKAGQQLTKLDRSALTQFATDPSKMPGYFFKTPTSFQHLIDLVGDKTLATQAGLDHITTELTSKDTSAKVRSWMSTHPEMLNAVPGAKLKVTEYANALESAEKSNASVDLGIKQLGERQTGFRTAAKTRATGITTGGEMQSNVLATRAKGIAAAGEAESNALLTQASAEAKALTSKAAAEAGAVTAESAAAADKIWNRASASPQLNARTLIENGDATQWALVAPIIQRSPAGKRDIYDALRETLADRLSSGNIKGATQRFNEVISPAMVKTGLLDASAAQDFAKQLAKIEAQRIPPAEELGRWNRMLLQAIAGHASSIGSRGARAGFSLVPDIPPMGTEGSIGVWNRNDLRDTGNNALTPSTSPRSQNRLNTYGIAQ